MARLSCELERGYSAPPWRVARQARRCRCSFYYIWLLTSSASQAIAEGRRAVGTAAGIAVSSFVGGRPPDVVIPLDASPWPAMHWRPIFSAICHVGRLHTGVKRHASNTIISYLKTIGAGEKCTIIDGRQPTGDEHDSSNMSSPSARCYRSSDYSDRRRSASA